MGGAVRIARLIADYERFTDDYPIEAGRSDPARAKQGWPRETLDEMAVRKAGLARIRDDLVALAGAPLDSEDAINRDYLREVVDWRIEGIDFDERRFAFVAHEGFHNTPYSAARGTMLRTERTRAPGLRGCARSPAISPSSATNLERGIATGWTQPVVVVDVAVAVLRNQVARAVAEDGLIDPIRALPNTIPAATRRALEAEAMEVLTGKVRPAQRAMLAFIDGRIARRHGPASASLRSRKAGPIMTSCCAITRPPISPPSRSTPWGKAK
jgi:uncharacterized protein (DUF885 family)